MPATISIAVGFALERQYSDVDNIANDYIASVLAFKHVSRADCTALERPLEPVLARGQTQLRRRVAWSLR
jgi:hypothetical protein